MKIGYLVTLLISSFSLIYFDVIDLREERAFLNYPFDKQMPQYPQFVDFVTAYEGRLEYVKLTNGLLIRRCPLDLIHQGG